MMNESRKERKPRKPFKRGTPQISITIPQQLINWVDVNAEDRFTTRSEIIRQALVFWLETYGLPEPEYDDE